MRLSEVRRGSSQEKLCGTTSQLPTLIMESYIRTQKTFIESLQHR